MSLINQPIVRKGTLVRRIDSYGTISGAANSQFIDLGTNLTSSQFASASGDRITINENAVYRVNLQVYANLLNGAGFTGAFGQFSFRVGLNIAASMETTNTTFTNNFQYSLFYDYGANSLSGSIPSFINGPGGFVCNANLSSSIESRLDSSSIIGLYISKTNSSSIQFRYGLAGYIFIEQIS